MGTIYFAVSDHSENVDVLKLNQFVFKNKGYFHLETKIFY